MLFLNFKNYQYNYLIFDIKFWNMDHKIKTSIFHTFYFIVLFAFSFKSSIISSSKGSPSVSFMKSAAIPAKVPTIPYETMGCNIKVYWKMVPNKGAKAHPNFPKKLVSPIPSDLTVVGYTSAV